MSESLAGKVIIITGASSGIGAAAARLFATQGARLALAARSIDKLHTLADELDADCLVLGADMTQPDAINDMVARTLAHFGRVDVMFANAGIFIQGDFAEYDMDAVSQLLRVNIEAALRCAKAVIPGMIAQGGGDILFTSSIAGHAELHRGPAYGASKHAIETLANTLRQQLMGDGIRVMSLAPGKVANELWGFSDPEQIRRLTIEDEQYLRVEDVAEAALFMLTRPRRVNLRTLVMVPRYQEA